MTISANYPTIRPTLMLDFANSAELDPRITFTRSTTANYYDGKTSVLAEQNLLLQSNTFGTTWVTTNGTLGAGVTDPAGSTTAYSLTATASNATVYQTLTLTATPYTISFWIQRVTGTGTINLTLDGTNFTAVTVTGSWVKYTATATPTAASHTIGIQVTTSGDVINIYGAQLENRSSATATNITTTAALNNYIPVLLSAPANQARFDHDPVAGTSLGLLIEQQSTNLQLQSQSFTVSPWTAGYSSNVAVTPNINIAPDGTQTASLLVNTTATGNHYLAPSNIGGSYTSGQIVTNTVYAKAYTARYLYIAYAGSQNNLAQFDLVAGTATIIAGSDTCAIQAVGNGWYRCTYYRTLTTTIIERLNLTSSPTTLTSSTWNSFTGDGYTGVYIWGVQVEYLAFPTSYIPTTSAAVTRTADTPLNSGANFSSWFNSQQGAIYCSFDTPTISSSASSMAIWAIDNGTNAQYYINKSTATLTAYEGSANASMGTITASTLQQSVYSFNNNSVSASGLINGGSVGTITATPQSIAPTQLSIGRYATSSNPFTGHIRKFAYYPTATTTAQMQALTGS